MRDHAIPVEEAGGRTAQGWEFTTWHDLVEIDAGRDREKIARFIDSDENKQLFLAIVDEFVRLARLQPTRPFLLHGDLGLDNMVIHDNRVVGLIDSGWFIGGNPLLDVSYLMNHVRIGAGEAKRGFFEGYGAADLEGRYDLMVFRVYHHLGKLIYLSAIGAREKYEQRRTQLRQLAAKVGFR
jgi:aminoglycoside phosphotransferase (APT) family kinase protein